MADLFDLRNVKKLNPSTANASFRCASCRNREVASWPGGEKVNYYGPIMCKHASGDGKARVMDPQYLRVFGFVGCSPEDVNLGWDEGFGVV